MSTITSCAQDSLLTAKFDYDGEEFSAKMNAHVRKHSNTLSGYLGTRMIKNETFRQLMDSACEVGVALIKFKIKKVVLLKLPVLNRRLLSWQKCLWMLF